MRTWRVVPRIPTIRRMWLRVILSLSLSFAFSLFAIAQTTTVYSYSVPSPTSTTGYAPNGNILSYSDSVMGSWTMQYDPLNRLQSAGATSGTYQGITLQWTYDAWGNRLSQTPSGSSSAPVPIATSTGYGANNRPLSALGGGSPSFDGAGNSNFDGVNQVMYDPENRICAVYNSNVGGPITQYLYNAEGQRIAKGHPLNNPTVLACPNGTSNFVTTATYIIGPSGEQMTELDGSNQWKHTNVFAGGQLLATYDQQGLHFPITDPLGTVRVQVSGTGVTEQNCASLPYGDGLNCTTSIQDPTEHHFTGKERDAESGLDYFGARYYGSTMGRFMNPDWSPSVNAVPYAKLTDPQSLNLYTYVGNNPLGRVDSDGHRSTLGINNEFAWGDVGTNSVEPVFNTPAGWAASNGLGGYGTPDPSAQQNGGAIATAAAGQNGSNHWSIKNWFFEMASGQLFRSGSDKCNAFVDDMVAAGGTRPLVEGTGRIPSAAEFADPNVSITGLSAPAPLSEAKPGDVIAQFHGTGTNGNAEGHVGIVVGPGQTASANANVGGRVTVNDWGFRSAPGNGERGPNAPPPVVRHPL